MERCDQCGFDGADWSTTASLGAVEKLPERWSTATSGLTVHDARRRPLPGMWSIVEYTDHVREVLFSMRFLLDTAVGQPGANLGMSPEPRFDPEPRPMELSDALLGMKQEAIKLHQAFSELGPDAWTATVVLDGDEIDPDWMARHAVHDATHHLLDIGRLREAL